MLAAVNDVFSSIAATIAQAPALDNTDIAVEAAKKFQPEPIIYASLAMLLAVLVLGGVLVWWHRARNHSAQGGDGFSLVGVRELHERGEITAEEYLNLRAKMIAKFKKSADFRQMPPEAVEPPRPVTRATQPDDAGAPEYAGEAVAEEPPEPVLDGDEVTEPGSTAPADGAASVSSGAPFLPTPPAPAADTTAGTADGASTAPAASPAPAAGGTEAAPVDPSPSAPSEPAAGA